MAFGPSFFFLAAVGEIFVPERAGDASTYVEHWVSFRDYVYPNGNSTSSTKIEAGKQNYRNEQDFFAQVPWDDGFRYIQITAAEARKPPGGR